MPARQLLLGLTLRPLSDPTLFPEPERLRLDLSPAQIEVIRLAWGVEPGSNAATENRFCKGLAYSITLMSRTPEPPARSLRRARALVDAPVQMFGTQSRKRFRAQLSPRR